MTDGQFAEQYMTHLNDQQREAVRATEGAVLLLAVPGSGKTTVLVTRLGYMTAVGSVDPRSILTMTYTRAATKEMRSRCAALFGEDTARQISFGTINAVSLDIVRYYSRNHGKAEMFELVGESDAAKIVAEIFRELNREYAADSTVKDIRTGITYAKNMLLAEDEIQKLETGVERFPEIFARYNKELKRHRLLDFDDQMVYALAILKGYPAVLERYQDRFRYLCVDESQDTSKIQHEIIRLLARKHGNIFMVGDEDQSIYGFRAAYPEALMRFKEDYPGAKVLLMEQNYRSTPEIITVSNAFVARNTDRYEKTMRAVRGPGEQVQIIRAKNREAQFKYLFAVAQNCEEQTAVLYRNNDSALPLIDLLERSGTPYACRNFDPTFFSHRVVGDISDIFRFAQDPANGELFQHIYYKFGSPIPRAAAVYACERSEKSGKPVLEELLSSPDLSGYGKDAVLELFSQFAALLKDDAETAVNRVWYGMRYGQFVKERRLDEGKHSILCMLGRHEPGAEALLRRLDTLREIIRTHRNEGGAKLLLSTIHSSKGLEYSRVYLLDVLDGILPALTEQEAKTPANWRQYQEERRLCYVGMTRAKELLYLFQCGGKVSEFATEISRSLPVELREDGDVFAPLRKNLVGRTYTDRELGRGVITAQGGDTLLVEFSSGAFRMFTLAEMWERRDTTPRYAVPEAETHPVQDKAPHGKNISPAALAAGVPVRHTRFGDGTVTDINPAKDRISIRFEKTGETKTFGLRNTLDRGFLQG